jgi:hypothetical protein
MSACLSVCLSVCLPVCRSVLSDPPPLAVKHSSHHSRRMTADEQSDAAALVGEAVAGGMFSLFESCVVRVGYVRAHVTPTICRLGLFDLLHSAAVLSGTTLWRCCATATTPC